MKAPLRTTVIAIIIAALGGLFCAAIAFWPEPEPSYQGKKLSYWLERLESETATTMSTGPSPETLTALKSIGTNAVPTLLRMFKAHDSNFKVRLMVLCEKIHVYYFTMNRQAILQSGALKGIQLLGPLASNGVPDLVKFYNDEPPSRMRTVAALTAIGPSTNVSKQTLIEILQKNPPQAWTTGPPGIDSWAFKSLKQTDPEAAAKFAADAKARMRGE